jgi:hypothetical protein
MVFFVSLKAYEQQLELAGIILNQPMLGGEQRTKSEIDFATDELFPLPVFDLKGCEMRVGWGHFGEGLSLSDHVITFPLEKMAATNG